MFAELLADMGMNDPIPDRFGEESQGFARNRAHRMGRRTHAHHRGVLDPGDPGCPGLDVPVAEPSLHLVQGEMARPGESSGEVAPVQEGQPDAG